jgi:hypothetical protein
MAQQTPQEKKQLKLELVTQMVTLSTSAFGLVAALAWNSVIQEFVTIYIKPLIGSGSGLISLLIYAVIVTILAVVITLQLSRLKEKLS